MTEGYLIVDVNADNIKYVELLVKNIKQFDPDRPVSIAGNEQIEAVENSFISSKIVFNSEFIEKNPNIVYFESVMKSPYDRTIVFLPDQLLTEFNTEVWENLRGLGPIVFPKTRKSFAYEEIPFSAYSHSDLEEKTFGYSVIMNCAYFDKSLGSDSLLGFAINLSASYQFEDYVEWFNETKKTNDIFLPSFPKWITPSWVVCFIKSISPEKIKFYDFINCIDLSKQENNFVNRRWSELSWNKFLSYWVTEDSDVKIENFIQRGLIKYQTTGWLNEKNFKNLNKFTQ
jgi:hypothetical protein